MTSRQQLPTMWERIQKCSFCGREVKSSALGFAENPYCAECLPERIAGATETALISWEVCGDYLRPIDLTRQKPQ
jgi:hypothetical protein